MNRSCLFVMAFLAAGVSTTQAEMLGDAELDQIHAGYMSTEGLPISLGAVMKSYVDGSLVLESTMTLNASGLTATHELGAGVQPLSSVPLTSAGAGGISVPVFSGPGAVVAGAGGATAFIHSLSGDGLTNMVVNTASNRDIVQTTAVTVAVPNLAAFQQQFGLASFAGRMHDTLGSGLLAATPH